MFKPVICSVTVLSEFKVHGRHLDLHDVAVNFLNFLAW